MDDLPRDAETGVPLSRHTFDQHWLHARPDDGELTELVQSLVDDNAERREQVRPFLAEAIVDHHFHRQRVATLVRQLGHEDAAKFFASELPKSNTTRKGNFGEVLASEHLVQRYGYEMPVFKLRFRDSHDLAMRGEDIIAFKLEGESITQVIIGEAKCVVRYGKATVRDAHKRLAQAVRPRPMTLSMLSEVLYTEGRDALAAEVDKVAIAFASRDFPTQNWIVLINQDQPDDPFSFLEDEDGELVDDLHCIGISLDHLTDLVNSVFEEPDLGDGDDDAP